MCLAAILWSGIGTVAFGSSIRFLQQQGWRQIDILAEEVVRRSTPISTSSSAPPPAVSFASTSCGTSTSPVFKRSGSGFPRAVHCSPGFRMKMAL
jgi:hypothetical protein